METYITYFTRSKPDPTNMTILYGNVFKDDELRFTLAVCPETHRGGWTGNAELWIRQVDSEEFDLIRVVEGLKQGARAHNTTIAKNLIVDTGHEWAGKPANYYFGEMLFGYVVCLINNVAAILLAGSTDQNRIGELSTQSGSLPSRCMSVWTRM